MGLNLSQVEILRNLSNFGHLIGIDSFQTKHYGSFCITVNHFEVIWIQLSKSGNILSIFLIPGVLITLIMLFFLVLAYKQY